MPSNSMVAGFENEVSIEIHLRRYRVYLSDDEIDGLLHEQELVTSSAKREIRRRNRINKSGLFWAQNDIPAVCQARMDLWSDNAGLGPIERTIREMVPHAQPVFLGVA